MMADEPDTEISSLDAHWIAMQIEEERRLDRMAELIAKANARMKTWRFELVGNEVKVQLR